MQVQVILETRLSPRIPHHDLVFGSVCPSNEHFDDRSVNLLQWRDRERADYFNRGLPNDLVRSVDPVGADADRERGPRQLVKREHAVAELLMTYQICAR